MKPIQSGSLVQAAEARIREHIRKRRLKPGDPLPGEIKLALDLGISRTILREAFSRLRAFGLIESRRRRGPVVAAPDLFAGLERVFDTLSADTPEHQAFAELRRVLEIGMADLVAERQTPADLQALDALVVRMRQATTRAQTVALDRQFHERLLQMTRNAAILRLGGLLRYDLERKARIRTRGDRAVPKPPEYLRNHEILVAALRSGDVARIREAFRRHFTPA